MAYATFWYSWLLITGALLFWQGRRFHKLRRALRASTSVNTPAELPALSVLIAARNEAQNLRAYLPHFLEQNYPQYEVIVINDRSTDDSTEVLEDLKQHYPHLRYQEIKSTDRRAGKKKALQKAMDMASHEGWVFSDADCRPASAHWLRYMGSGLRDHELVLGYGGLLTPPTFAGRLSQWETLQTAGQYYAAALDNRPYMGVGRNMGYRRSWYLRSGGLDSHGDLASGDDDLLVNSGPAPRSCGLLWPRESFTHSRGPENIQAWWRQKTRHYSTAPHYRSSSKIILAAEGAAQLLYYLLWPLALAAYPLGAVVIFGLRWAYCTFALRKLARHFTPGKGLYFYPLWEAFWAGSTALIHLKNSLQKPRQQW